MKCKCDDGRHDTATALWHRAYCNWCDADRAGHTLRARMWGFVADRVCNLNDRIFGWGPA